MEFEGIPRDGLKFLKDLARNNDRVWFKANKKRFDEAPRSARGWMRRSPA